MHPLQQLAGVSHWPFSCKAISHSCGQLLVKLKAAKFVVFLHFNVTKMQIVILARIFGLIRCIHSWLHRGSHLQIYWITHWYESASSCWVSFLYLFLKQLCI